MIIEWQFLANVFGFQGHRIWRLRRRGRGREKDENKIVGISK